MLQLWSCIFAGFYWTNLYDYEVREMNETGLAKRVLPCTKRGCRLSVVHISHPVAGSCSLELRRVLRLALGSEGKSVTSDV